MATKQLYDEHGVPHYCVDEILRRRLETKLIMKILDYMLECQIDDEKSLKQRIADFRKGLSKNQVLEEFDRGIFESIIEKVIVGGYDDNEEKDPYKITFIYKTGFSNGVGNAKQRFGKKTTKKILGFVLRHNTRGKGFVFR